MYWERDLFCVQYSCSLYLILGFNHYETMEICLYLSNLVPQLHKLLIIHRKLVGEDWLVGRTTYSFGGSSRVQRITHAHVAILDSVRFSFPSEENPFSYGKLDHLLSPSSANATRDEKALPIWNLIPFYFFVSIYFILFFSLSIFSSTHYSENYGLL